METCVYHPNVVLSPQYCTECKRTAAIENDMEIEGTKDLPTSLYPAILLNGGQDPYSLQAPAPIQAPQSQASLNKRVALTSRNYAASYTQINPTHDFYNERFALSPERPAFYTRDHYSEQFALSDFEDEEQVKPKRGQPRKTWKVIFNKPLTANDYLREKEKSCNTKRILALKGSGENEEENSQTSIARRTTLRDVLECNEGTLPIRVEQRPEEMTIMNMTEEEKQSCIFVEEESIFKQRPEARRQTSSRTEKTPNRRIRKTKQGRPLLRTPRRNQVKLVDYTEADGDNEYQMEG
ncbi:hypothetical protein B7494_g3906 [Chlorociboria aeruginascens]|nr:hypothetical protein B7494_g3906 [Chlorociboria aeruginascens]